jgi:transcription initiation factor IIE alpha subunit
MSGLLDSEQFAFSCPHCSREMRTTVGEMKRSDQKCPRCGTRFETSDFRRGIDEAERELDKFKRQLGNIKINIKL